MNPSLSVGGRTLRVSTLALSASLALALTGCAGVGSIPDTSVTSSAQPGAIQGSVFGGHAPIVGAHVYVLQAGTGGYASASTNLITSGSAGSDAYGKYVLTDSNGAFNVTGDYTCTVGAPVYIAAIAGATSTSIGGTQFNSTPLTISSAAPSGSNLVFQANNLLYPGQGVFFGNNLTGTGNYQALEGGTYYVTSANNTSFTIINNTGQTITGTTTGTATPVSAPNPAIANLAVLGNCPSTKNFSSTGVGSDPISYVYINEVSTAATAFAFAGFGSGPFNIGYPGGDALALTGIANAANNAGQLYNIEGAYISTTFAGEGHIANPVTPAGNGIVPQSTLDSLGNILASCVDSQNTGNGATNPNSVGSNGGTPSTNCSKLFTFTTSNGIAYGNTGSGAIATDTATAAFNIAHNPGANTQNLFYLQNSETIPFSPALGAYPNDYTLGIQYTAALNPGTGSNPAILKAPGSVAVDNSGNIWFTSEPTGGPPTGTNGYLGQLSPLGVISHSYYNNAYVYGDVMVDSSNNGWTGNQGAYVLATEDGPTTSYVPTSRGSAFTFAEAPIADNSATSGDVFIAHGPTNPPPGGSDNNQTLSEIFTDGTTSGTIGNMTPSFNAGAYMTHGAIDAAGYIWFTSNTATYGNTITRVAKGTGTAASGFPINAAAPTTGCPSTIASTILNPEQPAIDASGNAWIPILNGGAGNTVVKVTPTGVCTSFTVGNSPYGAAVDGAGNLWVSNSTGVSEVSTASGAVTGSYTVGGTVSGPAGIAVDLSGDVFVANFGGNSIVEVIGAAAPTYAPLGVAAGNNKLGAKP